jgi:predicted TIM-barrel fold metal-dependent hydrolase
MTTAVTTHENVVISMDGHTEGFVDLRSHMPEKWHGAFEEARESGRAIFTRAEHYFAALVEAGFDFAFELDPDSDFDPSSYDVSLTPEERLKCIDRDGVAAELIIDGFGAITDDPKLAHQVTLAFNRWFKDTYAAAAPERFHAAVVVNLIAGIETVVQEIDDAHRHGIKAIHLPGNPATALRELPHYNHSLYEPVWRALEELEMFAVFHASIGREKQLWRMDGAERANLALQMMDVMRSHETALAPLLLAGVPERYPSVKFGWIESGCAWVAPILDACDMLFHGPVDDPSHRLQMTPTEQWKASCFAAGPLSKADIEARHRIGVETIMFGSDFIHVEGTYPHSRRRLTELLSDVPAEDRFAICTGNGSRILRVDLDALAKTKAAQQQWSFADS